MSSPRTDAINDAYNNNRRGRGSFYYVRTDVLERLGITMYKTENGENFMRVIPPKDPKVMWAKEVHAHRNIGANGVTFLCLKKMFNEPCAICEYIDELKKNGEKEEVIKKLYAQTRYLMFVYDVRDESTMAKGLRWYDSPGKVVGNIVNLSRDKRTKATIDVSDPVEGRDIEFTRKGSSLSTTYEGFVLRPTDPIPEDWYSDVPDFMDVLLIPTYDQMVAELGVSDGDMESNPDQSGAGTSEEPEGEVMEEVEESQDKEHTEPSARPAPTPRGRTNSPGGTRDREAPKSEVSKSVRDRIEEIRRQRQNRG